MSRTTSDPKESVLKVRVSDYTRERAEKKAKMRNISLSEYIRKLIEKDLAT